MTLVGKHSIDLGGLLVLFKRRSTVADLIAMFVVSRRAVHGVTPGRYEQADCVRDPALLLFACRFTCSDLLLIDFLGAVHAAPRDASNYCPYQHGRVSQNFLVDCAAAAASISFNRLQVNFSRILCCSTV
jgi:hypothetical protein